MDVLSLMNTKNRVLERFLELTEGFLKSAEAGNFDDLEHFHNNRDSLLRGFGLYDRKLSEYISALPPAERTPELVEQARAAENHKEELIHRIFAIDEKIAARLSMEQTRIQKELTQAQKASAAIGKFKSGWITESGDELDRTL